MWNPDPNVPIAAGRRLGGLQATLPQLPWKRTTGKAPHDDPEVERVLVKYLNGPVACWRDGPAGGAARRRPDGALAGSALEKARKLGIKLVDERELRRLCLDLRAGPAPARDFSSRLPGRYSDLPGLRHLQVLVSQTRHVLPWGARAQSETL